MRLLGPHFHFVLVENNFATQVICKIIFDLHVETSHDDLLFCAAHKLAWLHWCSLLPLPKSKLLLVVVGLLLAECHSNYFLRLQVGG
jgi:hypothetical protein